MCFNVTIGHFWITSDVTFETSTIISLLFIFCCFYSFITLQFSLEKYYSGMFAPVIKTQMVICE